MPTLSLLEFLYGKCRFLDELSGRNHLLFDEFIKVWFVHSKKLEMFSILLNVDYV
ncbi:MAG: hypothetical protein K0Q73_2992 [Paenibacillus sp.]|nr:hypothetical protein [Paenibacillus sp.]